MAVPSVMSDLSVTAATNSPAGTESPTAGDDFLRAIQAIVRTTNAKGSDIASATTTDIGAATAEFVDVTGTTTITGLGTIAAGIRRTVRFTGILTLTYNATSLILPGSANIITANGDVAQFRSLGSGNWVCTSYTRRDGTTISGVTPGQIQAQTYTAFTTGGTSSAFTLTPSPAITANTANQAFFVKLNAAPTGSPTLAVSGLTALNLKYYDAAGTKQFVTSSVAPINWQGRVYNDGTDWILEDIVIPAASVANVNARTSTGTVVTPASLTGILVNGTTVATTSGTSLDFTGLPTWVKRITIMFNGFSTNGTSIPILQIGNTTPETTGYLGCGNSTSGAGSTSTNQTTGFAVAGINAAANVRHGAIVLTTLGANIWVAQGITALSNTTQVDYIGGSKTTSGTIDRIRLTTVAGVDTFDAGSVNIIYE